MPRIIRSGSVSIDKYGLATATVVWWAFGDERMRSARVSIGSRHPDVPGLECERLVTGKSDGGVTLEAHYAGIVSNKEPEPVDELDVTVTEAPIEAHPRFSELAGTPEAPNRANDARWTPDGSGGFVFGGFGPNGPAGLRGVTSFIIPTAISRRTTISKAAPVAGNVGKRGSPGSTFGVSGDWLMVGVSSQRRGSVFVTRREWKASGALGWHNIIYS